MRASVAAVEVTVSDETPPAHDVSLPPVCPARQGQHYLKSLLEKQRYISPLQHTVIKNKAETTHSCIAVGEKGKAAWRAAGCGLRRAMALVASHPWRRRFEPPRLYLPAPLHSAAFLFRATFITLSTSLLSPALCCWHIQNYLLFYSRLCSGMCSVQRGKLIRSMAFPSNRLMCQRVFYERARTLSFDISLYWQYKVHNVNVNPTLKPVKHGPVQTGPALRSN